MTCRVVELAVHPFERGAEDEKGPTSTQRFGGQPDLSFIVFDVFENVEVEDRIERPLIDPAVLPEGALVHIEPGFERCEGNKVVEHVVGRLESHDGCAWMTLDDPAGDGAHPCANFENPHSDVGLDLVEYPVEE